MIFSNHKNLEPYSNGQGYRLLYLLLDVTSAHVMLYGIPQCVQCTHHWLTFILLKFACIPFLSANIRRCLFVKKWVISQWFKQIFHSNWFDMQIFISNSLCNQLAQYAVYIWGKILLQLIEWMGTLYEKIFNAFWSDCIDCRGTDNVLWCCVVDFIYSASCW